MFENKDKDLDGRLSFEEFMGEESRAERLFKLMDKDNDGWVTKHVSGHFVARLINLGVSGDLISSTESYMK